MVSAMQSRKMGIFLSTPSVRRATWCQWFCTHSCVISIHALREEGDVSIFWDSAHGMKFLSTPSVRRATKKATYVLLKNSISIHALREEGDGSLRPTANRCRYFYPRPP